MKRWDEMTARERDALVATEVMGWRVYHYDKDVPDRCYYMLVDENFDPVANDEPFDPWHNGERKTEEEAWNDCPNFTTNIADAWAVVEKFLKDGFNVNMLHDELGAECEIYERISGHHMAHEIAPTAPLAISLAALRAVGCEVGA